MNIDDAHSKDLHSVFPGGRKCGTQKGQNGMVDEKEKNK